MIPIHRILLVLGVVCGLNANAQTPGSAVNSALDGQLFYQLLLGELNARGTDPGAGYSLILDAARRTRNTSLYQRAVDIALQARSGDSALLAARAWQQALPESREANRYLLQILISLNRIPEVLDPLKREIAATDPKDRPLMVSAIPRFLARVSDKTQAADVVQQALKGYLTEPSVGVEAWTVIGRMRVEAGDRRSAINAVHQALALDNAAESPIRLALTLIDPATPEAELIVKKHLTGPKLPEIRMAYSRALLNAQRYEDAAVQLETVTSDKPDLAEAWLLRGALELQNNKSEEAERFFRQYLSLAPGQTAAGGVPEPDRGVTQALLSLSQIAEQRQDFVAAENWLQRAVRPEDFVSVQLRRAALLARQGKLAEARELIRNQAERSPAEAKSKIIAEAQLLRDAKQFMDAHRLLSEARERHVDDLDLAYDLAMVSEKIGKVDEMESLLRLIISIKPDHHHAYNALGYSLAERNTRLPEARQLILKALELAPGDPFIMDSLGWVEFRSGNLAEARRILQSAFETRPDAEIAAHLGEVLWTMNKQMEAKAIWKQAQKLNAQNDTLLETLLRLRVAL